MRAVEIFAGQCVRLNILRMRFDSLQLQFIFNDLVTGKIISDYLISSVITRTGCSN